MKQTLFFLLSTLLCWNITYSQIANGPLVYETCDDNVESDGDLSNDSVQFDLSSLDFQILGSQNPSGFTVSYHLTQIDADNNINPLPILYTNTSNPETIFGRVSENSSSNFDTTTITLIVNNLPNINLSGDFFICNTGSTTIIDTNPAETNYTYEWTLNGSFLPESSSTLTIDQAGNYAVIVTKYSNVTACSIQDGFTIQEIDCIDTDSDGVIDFEEDLNSNGNLEDDNTDMDSLANYLDNDDDNDGILTIDEDYNNNGDPTDDDTDNSGIPDYLESNVALSILSFKKLNFKMFPNPSNDLVTIKSSNTISNILIFDVQGKQVDLEIIKDSISEIYFSVKDLKSGIYFIKIQNNFTQSIKKLVVE
ncbi:T9SS type A sorting domain-containing protein [uncultured Algibacter sp.]|uniref:T9SS type A sorting domain-containing protein n=1 Tax=uncultured Algibacter sp. TaxID=298659 RepID=UPI00261265BA|nr:T9SS type A sorting domain-containing protein [uncultured Algibacter sp.]